MKTIIRLQLIACVLLFCTCTETPKKVRSKLYISTLNVGEDWKYVFNYTNDTTLIQTDLYFKNSLVRNDKFTYVDGRTVVMNSYYQPKDVFSSINKITLSGNLMVEIAKTEFFSSGGGIYKFDWRATSLAGYSYNGINEIGTINTLSNYYVVDRQIGSKQESIKVNFDPSLPGIWKNVSNMALLSIMFQHTSIFECFSNYQVNSVQGQSYGDFEYSEFSFDQNNYIKSMRRTDKNSLKYDYYQFQWR